MDSPISGSVDLVGRLSSIPALQTEETARAKAEHPPPAVGLAFGSPPIKQWLSTSSRKCGRLRRRGRWSGRGADREIAKRSRATQVQDFTSSGGVVQRPRLTPPIFPYWLP